MHRFIRTEMLLGKPALQRLQHARVAVVGLGAVGSYAVEGLARAGVGHLRLVDFDVVRESNINRQLYALQSTLDRPKAEVARARVLDINPQCEVEALRVFADDDTFGPILRPPLDALIDAVDSLGPKVRLLAAAVKAGATVVSSMGAATRTEPQAIRVADISATDVCPLARLVRKRLRRQGVERGILCVYSVEPPRGSLAVEGAAEAAPAEAPPCPRGRERRPLGSLACLTGIFGLTAANEVILGLTQARHSPAISR